MELIIDGKTKTVYALDDQRVRIVFKDDITGTDGVADPGGDQVVGQVEGKGLLSLKQSVYFFELLADRGIPTHFIAAELDEHSLIAHRAAWSGLEFIVRFFAYGSFVRRYGLYAKEGQDLGGLVEVTLKDDQRGDPLIIDEAVAALGLMSLEHVGQAKHLALQAAQIIRSHLQAKGVELVDMKFECGLVADRLVITDDISTDNMRLLRQGQPVSGAELWQLLT